MTTIAMTITEARRFSRCRLLKTAVVLDFRFSDLDPIVDTCLKILAIDLETLAVDVAWLGDILPELVRARCSEDVFLPRLYANITVNIRRKMHGRRCPSIRTIQK